jgi:hypothetical protein
MIHYSQRQAVRRGGMMRQKLATLVVLAVVLLGAPITPASGGLGNLLASIPGSIGEWASVLTRPAKSEATPLSYPDVVGSDNPLAYYRLNEASGTTAADSSGNGHTATYGGNVTLGEDGLVGDVDDAIGVANASGSAITASVAAPATRSIEVWRGLRMGETPHGCM